MLHGKIRANPPPQAAGTLFFLLGVDEVPVAGGSRPHRLAPVSGPQERVQRHSVEQIIDTFARAGSRCSCGTVGGSLHEC